MAEWEASPYAYESEGRRYLLRNAVITPVELIDNTEEGGDADGDY